MSSEMAVIIIVMLAKAECLFQLTGAFFGAPFEHQGYGDSQTLRGLSWQFSYALL